MRNDWIKERTFFWSRTRIWKAREKFNFFFFFNRDKNCKAGGRRIISRAAYLIKAEKKYIFAVQSLSKLSTCFIWMLIFFNFAFHLSMPWRRNLSSTRTAFLHVTSLPGSLIMKTFLYLIKYLNTRKKQLLFSASNTIIKQMVSGNLVKKTLNNNLSTF